jgi:nucleoside phosphorylase
VTIDLAHYGAALNESYVLVLTSNSREKAAVRSVLVGARPIRVPFSNRCAEIAVSNDRFFIHLSGDSGVSQNVSVARIANAALSGNTLPRPALVLLVGFCWGKPTVADIGSIVISREVIAVNRRVELPTGGVVHPRRQQSRVPLSDDCISMLLEVLPNAVIGPILSAEMLLQSDEARRSALEVAQDAVAGEMEAFGFVGPDFPWLVLKAVSDTGGDSFHRDGQDDAAKLAALSISSLISALERASELPVRAASSVSDRLRYALKGDLVSLDSRMILTDGPGKYLNDEIGGWLEDRIRDFGVDVTLQRLVLSAVLEACQNAATHGRAASITIRVRGGGIEVRDDGMEFNFHQLRGGRGGAHASTQIQSVDGLQSDYRRVAGENIHAFEFTGASLELASARRNCSVEVRRELFRRAPGHAKGLLIVKDTCRVVHLDASPLRMASLRFDLVNAICDLIERYEKVYLGCECESDAAFFRENLAHLAGDSLVVFVE